MQITLLSRLLDAGLYHNQVTFSLKSKAWQLSTQL